MVTSSVQMAGVLVVFSLLIVPTACAALFLASLRGRLLALVPSRIRVVASATAATGTL